MIVSIENFRAWSWSNTLSKMIPYLEDSVSRVVRRIADCTPFFNFKENIYLLQNVDCFQMLSNTRLDNVVCRLGGFALEYEEKIHEGTVYDNNLKSVGAIIATNPTLYEYGRSLNPNTHLIANGVDLELFRPPAIPLVHPKFQVGFVGNINSSFFLTYKGYQYAAGATNELYNEVDLVTALYRHNQIPHEDMAQQFYHKVHCVVNMSYGEGCSNTIMEALACGVPVICTKVGYHGAMLTQDENVLFVERSAEQLRDAILRLRDDKVLYHHLSHGGRKFAEKYHNLQIVADQYNEVFETLL